jgi:hypothetical protein
MMPKTSALALAGAAVGSFLSVSAGAFPAAQLEPKANSDITLAAEGCGPGWHRGLFGRCVRDEFFGRFERDRRACGFGLRWSYSRGRCVPD